MTPKDKAEEIYKRILEVNKFFTPFENLNQPKIVKECALIAVGEIIESVKFYSDVQPLFWQKVKQELLNL